MLVCPLCRIVLAANESVCPRDGHTGRDAALHAVVPGLAKRFHVIEPFAQGDTGSLYLADEPETGRRGLLKVLPAVPRSLQAERQRLRREVVKQGSLESAHLIAPFATGETEGQVWIFREWLEGVSLRVRLARQGALPQAQALSIAAQLAVALDELHRAGLLHRDLKPGHILLDAKPDGLTAVRVIDPGICAPLSLGGETLVLGTPGYVAPEQLSGKLVSFRSDLYALGCVLFEMLTGRPTFAGPNVDAVLRAQREGIPGQLPENLPEGVSSLLRSLLGKDPQERPFSAQKLRRTLDPYLPDGAAVTRLPTKTFANVSEPKKVKEPTGTLRPPAPPSTAPGPVTGAASPPGAPGKVSVPPPAPPARAKPPQDATQRLEIDQILASAPAKPRVSAPPPPPRASLAPPAAARVSAPPPAPPRARVSVPPPAPPAGRGPSLPPRVSAPPAPNKPHAAAKDPTEAIDFAEVLDEGEDDDVAPAQPGSGPAAQLTSELTQPIRLEQVLAVAEARQRKSVPSPHTPVSGPGGAPSVIVQSSPEPTPPVAQQPARPSPEPAVQVAPAPEAAPEAPARTTAPYVSPAALGTPEPAAAPAAQPPASSQTEGDISLDTTIEHPRFSSAPPTSAVEAGGSAREQNAETIAAADEEPDEGEAALEDEATSVSFKPAARALASKKRTLIGRAVTDASAQRAPQATAPGAIASATVQVGQEARVSTPKRADYEDTLDGSEDNLYGTRAPSQLRQYWPYAAAALLLLSVGGALVAALSGGDDGAVASLAEPSVPAALPAAAAPTPAVMPLAVAPKVEPVAEPTPVVEVAALPTAPSVEPAPSTDEPAAEEVEEEEEDSKVQARTSDSRKSIGKSKRDRERKRDERSAKASGSKGSSKASAADDKEQRWAKARQEAQAHYAAKRYKQAAQAYEIAAKNNPTHAGTFAGLGASRLKAGDERGAVQAYQKAVQISPSTSGFHAALGKAYAAQGDKSKARAAYKRALALDPKNEAAKAALKELG